MIINKLLSFVLLLSPFSLLSQVIPISTARALPPGSVVAVRGVVTNGAELGKIRFLQDGTAGIAAFPGAGSAAGFDATVQAGDSIELSGTTVLFHNLLEINPVSSWQVISSGNPLPAPKPVGLAGLSEDLEGQLVSVECVTFSKAGGIFASAGAYDISDIYGASGQIYLRGDHPLENTGIPGAPVRLTAVLSEYDDFQLLPRSATDFAEAPCFYFSGKPRQSAIETDGFTISWETNLPASAKLRFGPSPNPVHVVNLAGQSPANSYELTGLQPGTVYWIQIEATHVGDIILSEPTPFATQSLSSGQIKLYFNHPIDESSAQGLLPAGQSFTAVRDETLARIAAAQQTIDVAMYTNNRSDITQALKDAQTRGLRVRYVAALDGNSPALTPPPAFPVLYGNNSALMHNKFMVIDADLADRCWVMSGSMNWTTGNMALDYNNTLFIQDQSLARAYEIEFEEMWGSDGSLPDPQKARFSGAKKNNTPHQFVIGNIPVESYFSPSDQVTSRITEALETADGEALFALLTFTKDEQADALVEAFDGGVQVRGLIENTGDTGSEFNYLISNGISVQQHSASGIMHHKYGVVDAGTPDSAPLVVTGSHNWTFAAETANDENTLVIHDAGIATLFKAEFERRWVENSVSVKAPDYQGIKIYPNPVADVLILQSDALAGARLQVKNALGTTVLQASADGTDAVRLQIGALQPGFYFAIIETRHGFAAVPFQKI